MKARSVVSASAPSCPAATVLTEILRSRRFFAARSDRLLLPDVPDNLAAYPLLKVSMLPVVAPSHALAFLGRIATQSDLEPHVQLVLFDPVDPVAASYGLSSAQLWRFVDLGRRLDFLLAGFGWYRVPDHLVAPLIASGKLVALGIQDDRTPGEGIVIHAAHRRDRALEPAGRWLLDRLRRRLATS